MASREPDALTSLLSQMSLLVRRAYDEGHRAGVNFARDRMLRAASVDLESAPSALTNSSGAFAETTVVVAPEHQMKTDLSGHRVRSRYGGVASRVREALLLSDGVGITSEELLMYCRSKGMDVVPATIKEAIRSLISREEVVRRGGVLFPGERLKAYAEPHPSDNITNPPPTRKSEVEQD